MTQPVKRKRGRPSKAEASPDLDIDDLIGAESADDTDGDEGFDHDITTVLGGVSAYWLGQVFGHDKNTIKRKLGSSGCKVYRRRGKTPLYLIKDAAQYLVTPKVDIESYIKSLRPVDMPPSLNKDFWAAALARQKWEENAKQLWRTADVLEVFGDTALHIKSTVTLWVEELDRAHGLTAEQRETIQQLSDNLLEQVHDMMVTSPARGNTPSSAAEHDLTETDEVDE